MRQPCACQPFAGAKLRPQALGCTRADREARPFACFGFAGLRKFSIVARKPRSAREHFSWMECFSGMADRQRGRPERTNPPGDRTGLSKIRMVPEARVELARQRQRFLRPPRLPFRHSGAKMHYIRTAPARQEPIGRHSPHRSSCTQTRANSATPSICEVSKRPPEQRRKPDLHAHRSITRNPSKQAHRHAIAPCA